MEGEYIKLLSSDANSLCLFRFPLEIAVNPSIASLPTISVPSGECYCNPDYIVVDIRSSNLTAIREIYLYPPGGLSYSLLKGLRDPLKRSCVAFRIMRSNHGSNRVDFEIRIPDAAISSVNDFWGPFSAHQKGMMSMIGILPFNSREAPPNTADLLPEDLYSVASSACVGTVGPPQGEKLDMRRVSTPISEYFDPDNPHSLKRISTGLLNHQYYAVDYMFNFEKMALCSLSKSPISSTKGLGISKNLVDLQSKLDIFRGPNKESVLFFKYITPDKEEVFISQSGYISRSSCPGMGIFPSSGILADEMGIGKTLSTLALIDYTLVDPPEEGKTMNFHRNKFLSSIHSDPCIERDDLLQELEKKSNIQDSESKLIIFEPDLDLECVVCNRRSNPGQCELLWSSCDSCPAHAHAVCLGRKTPLFQIRIYSNPPEVPWEGRSQSLKNANEKRQSHLAVDSEGATENVRSSRSVRLQNGKPANSVRYFPDSDDIEMIYKNDNSHFGHADLKKRAIMHAEYLRSNGIPVIVTVDSKIVWPTDSAPGHTASTEDSSTDRKGTEKCFCAKCEAQSLKSPMETSSTLVLAPRRLVPQWAKQIEAHTRGSVNLSEPTDLPGSIVDISSKSNLNPSDSQKLPAPRSYTVGEDSIHSDASLTTTSPTGAISEANSNPLGKASSFTYMTIEGRETTIKDIASEMEICEGIFKRITSYVFHEQKGDSLGNESVEKLRSALSRLSVLRKQLYCSEIAAADIVLAPFDHFQKLISERSPVPKIAWRRICIDECQQFENKGFKSLNQLTYIHLWLISGTPLIYSSDLFTKFSTPMRLNEFAYPALTMRWDEKYLHKKERENQLLTLKLACSLMWRWRNELVIGMPTPPLFPEAICIEPSALETILVREEEDQKAKELKKNLEEMADHVPLSDSLLSTTIPALQKFILLLTNNSSKKGKQKRYTTSLEDRVFSRDILGQKEILSVTNEIIDSKISSASLSLPTDLENFPLPLKNVFEPLLCSVRVVFSSLYLDDGRDVQLLKDSDPKEANCLLSSIPFSTSLSYLLTVRLFHCLLVASFKYLAINCRFSHVSPEIERNVKESLGIVVPNERNPNSPITYSDLTDRFPMTRLPSFLRRPLHYLAKRCAVLEAEKISGHLDALRKLEKQRNAAASKATDLLGNLGIQCDYPQTPMVDNLNGKRVTNSNLPVINDCLHTLVLTDPSADNFHLQELKKLVEEFIPESYFPRLDERINPSVSLEDIRTLRVWQYNFIHLPINSRIVQTHFNNRFNLKPNLRRTLLDKFSALLNEHSQLGRELQLKAPDPRLILVHSNDIAILDVNLKRCLDSLFEERDKCYKIIEALRDPKELMKAADDLLRCIEKSGEYDGSFANPCKCRMCNDFKLLKNYSSWVENPTNTATSLSAIFHVVSRVVFPSNQLDLFNLILQEAEDFLDYVLQTRSFLETINRNRACRRWFVSSDSMDFSHEGNSSRWQENKSVKLSSKRARDPEGLAVYTTDSNFVMNSAEECSWRENNKIFVQENTNKLFSKLTKQANFELPSHIIPESVGECVGCAQTITDANQFVVLCHFAVCSSCLDNVPWLKCSVCRTIFDKEAIRIGKRPTFRTTHSVGASTSTEAKDSLHILQSRIDTPDYGLVRDVFQHHQSIFSDVSNRDETPSSEQKYSSKLLSITKLIDCIVDVEIMKSLSKIGVNVEKELRPNPQSPLDDRNVQFKLNELRQKLPEDHATKIVVFSRNPKALTIVKELLEKAKISVVFPTEPKDVSTDVPEFCDSLETGVLLLDVKLAGTGLNIVAANHMIFLEPILDSILRLQAMARIQRIGNRKNCFCHTLVLSDSIEERIYAFNERMSSRTTSSNAPAAVSEEFDMNVLFERILDRLRNQNKEEEKFNISKQDVLELLGERILRFAKEE